MYGKIIFNALFIVLISVLQISFIESLPGPLSELRVFIIALVFILILADLETALWWAVGLGFFLDLYSFAFFGGNIVVLTTSIALANLLLVKYFTNRSLYSFLALSAFAVLFQDLALYLIGFIADIGTSGIFLKVSFQDALNESKIIFANLVVCAILFYAANFISHSLKPVFLVRAHLKNNL